MGVKTMFADAYKAAVPTRERMFIRGMMGDTSPVDESYMRPEDIAAMQRMVRVNEKLRADPRMTEGNQHRKLVRSPDGGINFSEDLYTGPVGKKVSYDTYESANALGVPEDVTELPREQMGQFHYDADADGNVIVQDRYDFNQYPAGQEPSLREVATNAIKQRSMAPVAGYLGSKFIPDDGKHGYDVRVNIGKPSMFKKGDK